MLRTALLLMSLSAPAQVEVNVAIPVPTVRFAVTPVVVEAEPGIQVVENAPEEVFLVEGYYWLRSDGRWYRSRSHKGGWVYVQPGVVPPRLVRVPPGHYKHWKRKHDVKHDKHDKHSGKGKGHKR